MEKLVCNSLCPLFWLWIRCVMWPSKSTHHACQGWSMPIHTSNLWPTEVKAKRLTTQGGLVEKVGIAYGTSWNFDFKSSAFLCLNFSMEHDQVWMIWKHSKCLMYWCPCHPGHLTWTPNWMPWKGGSFQIKFAIGVCLKSWWVYHSISTASSSWNTIVSPKKHLLWLKDGMAARDVQDDYYVSDCSKHGISVWSLWGKRPACIGTYLPEIFMGEV